LIEIKNLRDKNSNSKLLDAFNPLKMALRIQTLNGEEYHIQTRKLTRASIEEKLTQASIQASIEFSDAIGFMLSLCKDIITEEKYLIQKTEYDTLPQGDTDALSFEDHYLSETPSDGVL